MPNEDGIVVCSNLKQTPTSPGGGMYNNVALYVGQVIEVIPIDADRNRSKRYCEYDVLVIENSITQSVYRNCKCVDSLGGENNFQESTFTPVTYGSRTKTDDSEEILYKNGALVVIGCINANKEGAIIIAGVQHPNINLKEMVSKVQAFAQVGSSTSRDDRLKALPTLNPGVRKEDGKRILGEYNGVRWNVNKDGELTIIYQGPKNDKGELINPDTQPTTLKFNKDGEFFIIDNLDQEIKVSRKDEKILLSSGNKVPDYIEIDRANQNITLEMSKNEIHTVGQNKESTIGKDEIEDIKGKSNITVGDTRTMVIKKDRLEQITGTWRAKTGGGVVFDYPTMKLGSDGASEPVVLGNTWDAYHTSVIVATLNLLIAQVATLVTTFGTHTHDYAIPDHSSGSGPTGSSNSAGPSGPAAVAPAPAACYSKKTTSE